MINPLFLEAVIIHFVEWLCLRRNLVYNRLFQKKNWNPLLRISMEISKRVEWKQLDFQGGVSKFEGKTRISKGVKASGKF